MEIIGVILGPKQDRLYHLRKSGSSEILIGLKGLPWHSHYNLNIKAYFKTIWKKSELFISLFKILQGTTVGLDLHTKSDIV